MITSNLLEEKGVYPAERSLILLLTSLRPRLQPHSSFTKNVLNGPLIPKTRKANFSLIESKRDSASKLLVINLPTELSVRFHLKLNAEPVFVDQKWMYHSQVSKLMDLVL